MPSNNLSIDKMFSSTLLIINNNVHKIVSYLVLNVAYNRNKLSSLLANIISDSVKDQKTDFEGTSRKDINYIN